MTSPDPKRTAEVRRRRLHYFSGFDPRGAAHYHRLCREEAAKPQPSGDLLSVGPREKLDRRSSRWTVDWKDGAQGKVAVSTEHVFMSWDDIVRAHWTRGPFALAADFVRTYAHLFRHIGARRVWRMYPPAFKAGVLPLALVLAPLLVAIALGSVIGWWGALAGLALGAGLWVLAGRAGLFWLLRIYGFFRRMGAGPVAGLEERTREWVDLIVARQEQDPVDEVLLVGHSVGTLVMLDAVDALLEDPRWQVLQAGRPTAMLTLGHSIPMVAIPPAAHAFRATVERLSRDRRLFWWDVTARIDPLCFYNLHPLAGSGVPHADARWPLLHTARFMHMYEPAAWARIRADKLQAHFLYLHTPQKRGNFSPYDVFYGPQGLQAHAGIPRRPATHG